MSLDLTQFTLFLIFSFGLGFIGLLLLRLGQTTDRTFENRLFLTAFILRCLAAVVIFLGLSYFNGLPFVSFGNDDYSYHERALALASQWATGEWFYPTYHAAAYDSLSALFYLAFGPVPLVIRALQCFAGALCATYTYRIAVHWFGPVIGRRAGLLVALLPDLVFWSAVQYREMILAALILYLVWFVTTRTHSSASINSLLSPIIALAAYIALDLYGATILAFCLATHYLINRRKRGDGHQAGALRRFIITGLIVSVMSILFWFGNSLKDEQSSLVQAVTVGEQQRDNVMQASEAGSLSSQFLGQGTGFGLLLAEPVRFLFPIFLPIPFRSPSFDMSILSMGSLIWYLMMPFALYGLIHCLKHRPRETFLLYAIPFFSLLGIYFLFYSGSPRYKARFMPLLWILSAVGMADSRRLRLVYVISLSVLAMIFLTYLMIKAGL